ncbi:MAG: DEAD/DEAH box helicase family protein [bacterium]
MRDLGGQQRYYEAIAKTQRRQRTHDDQATRLVLSQKLDLWRERTREYLDPRILPRAIFQSLSTRLHPEVSRRRTDSSQQPADSAYRVVLSAQQKRTAEAIQNLAGKGGVKRRESQGDLTIRHNAEEIGEIVLDLLKEPHTLMPHQVEALTEIGKALKEGHNHIMCEQPVGSGKSYEIAAIARTLAAKGKKIVIVTSRSNLIDDLVERTIPNSKDRNNIISTEVGRTDEYQRPITVVHYTTFGKAVINGNLEISPDTLFLLDEYHNAAAEVVSNDDPFRMSKRGKKIAFKGLQQILKNGATAIGFTATPMIGRGHLADLNDVYVAHRRNLLNGVRDKYVSPFIVAYLAVSKSLVDLTRFQDREQIDKVELGKELTNDDLHRGIFLTWQQYCQDDPTIVFCATVDQSKRLAEQFNSWNGEEIAIAISRKTSRAEQKRIREAINNGTPYKGKKISVVINAGIWAEGTDVKRVKNIIKVDPTYSWRELMQQMGRGLRPISDSIALLIECHYEGVAAKSMRSLINGDAAIPQGDDQRLHEIANNRRQPKGSATATEEEVAGITFGFDPELLAKLIKVASTNDLIVDRASPAPEKVEDQNDVVLSYNDYEVTINGCGQYLLVRTKGPGAKKDTKAFIASPQQVEKLTQELLTTVVSRLTVDGKKPRPEVVGMVLERFVELAVIIYPVPMRSDEQNLSQAIADAIKKSNGESSLAIERTANGKRILPVQPFGDENPDDYEN